MSQENTDQLAVPETAYLAGGCFWCLEAVYVQVKGVLDVQSGYMGGHIANPTYEQVCSGRSGHAEVVRLLFDPSLVSYRSLLEVFFAIHDPTTPDRQGGDVGPQYRSAIFYVDEAQRDTAAAVIAEFEAEKVFPAPIVTQIEEAPVFYAAEPYHDDYYQRNPGAGYCQFVIAPKVAKFRKLFTAQVAPAAR
jgi:peptide-methionine (S)-S-oxide reductase